MNDSGMELVEALFAQSNMALNAQDFAEAEALLRQALCVDVEVAELHANLAWLLERRGVLDDALVHYAHASLLQPDNALIHVNHGALLATLGQHEAAAQAYHHALAIAPDMPGAWSNLGALQAQHGQDEAAQTSLRTALVHDPAHAQAHVNLAFLLLRKGQYAEGWAHLEHRDWYMAIAARLDLPRWHGEAVAQRRILVVYEAGHGDVIQFCRYASLLQQQGATVGMLCHPALTSLLTSLAGVQHVVGYDEALDPAQWDCWTPLMSLPHRLGNTLDTIPATTPYLRAHDDLLATWAAKVHQCAPTPGLRVGVVWRGNPSFINDAHRSLPGVHTLAPLWQVPGAHWFSLQKGGDDADSAHTTQPLHNMTAELHNFADTAALIAQLDLVIGVDTAVVHLAGAVGTPCWVMLPAFMPDWRWLEDRTDSPWYPGTMRLFRQQHAGDWADAIRAMQARLPTLQPRRSTNAPSLH